MEASVVAGPGRWNQAGPSEFPWEQDALDHVRNLMPDTEPYRAWAIFSFTSSEIRFLSSFTQNWSSRQTVS